MVAAGQVGLGGLGQALTPIERHFQIISSVIHNSGKKNYIHGALLGAVLTPVHLCTKEIINEHLLCV